MFEISGEALYLVCCLVGFRPWLVIDVTLAFEDAQVIQPFPTKETDNTDDTDDTENTESTDDRDGTEST